MSIFPTIEEQISALKEESTMKTFVYYNAQNVTKVSFQGDSISISMGGTIVTIILNTKIIAYINLAPGDYIEQTTSAIS